MCSIRKVMISILAVTICTSMLVTVSVYAASREVDVENHMLDGDNKRCVSGITIDDVTAPEPDDILDESARVTTAEGVTWEIHVIWVDDAFQLSNRCDEGKTYLPVLIYYVPADYMVQGDTYSVTLSDALTSLFGTQEITSIYNTATGLTFILTASLRDNFANQGKLSNENRNNTDENLRENAPAVLGSPVSEGSRNLVNDVNLVKDIVIVPGAKDLQIVNVKAKARKGRKALITWKKNKKASGYQICFSTNKNFKKAVKKIMVKKASFNKAWLRGLKSGRTYYVKVRAMKKITSPVTGRTEAVYGKWSATRKFKAGR